MRPKASGAGLICRTDQYFQRQRPPYTCGIKTVKSVRYHTSSKQCKRVLVSLSKALSPYVENQQYDTVYSYIQYCEDSSLRRSLMQHGVNLTVQQNDKNLFLAVPCYVQLTQTNCWYHGLCTASFGLRSFSSSGPTAWNDMPAHLRNLVLSLSDFTQLLKTALFRTVTV